MTGEPPPARAPRAGSILRVAALVCIACCVGPILGVLGAVTALGLVSTLLIGALGLLLAAAFAAAVILHGRRRKIACATATEPVPIELSNRG
jgi:hypothetical protein